MNRELLEKPFEPGQIRQREGNFGKMLDYIEGHTVIQRLQAPHADTAHFRYDDVVCRPRPWMGSEHARTQFPSDVVFKVLCMDTQEDKNRWGCIYGDNKRQ